MSRTLVVATADTSTHRSTFDRFRENLLYEFQADLAPRGADQGLEGESDSPYHQHARYVWTSPTFDDWGPQGALEARLGLHVPYRSEYEGSRIALRLLRFGGWSRLKIRLWRLVRLWPVEEPTQTAPIALPRKSDSAIGALSCSARGSNACSYVDFPMTATNVLRNPFSDAFGEPMRRHFPLSGTLRAFIVVVAALTWVLESAPAAAQQLPVGDPREEYLRVLQVIGSAGGGSFTVRPRSLFDALGEVGADTLHPWHGRLTPPTRRPLGGWGDVTVVDPGLRLFMNSAFPDGANDGPVWQGQGLTAALDGGATVSMGPLTVTAHPLATWTQNGAFDEAAVRVAGASPDDYPWRVIDLPQRRKGGSFARLYPGDSSVRLRGPGLEVGFGTENLWWGPALRNPIIMSNNAAGFPHAFLGTNHPIDVTIGTLEAQWLFGRLQASDGFTADTIGRYITGAVVAFTPRGTGLTLGIERMFYAGMPEGGLGLADYLLVVQGVEKKNFSSGTNPSGDDNADQLFGAFARWVLPESGFESWVEWTRNDHGWDIRDYFLEPEHAQAYTVGFRKAQTLVGRRLLAVWGEITHLERSVTARGRAVPTYYSHHIVKAGYTQRGEIIGAALGPGGNGQAVGADLYAPWGKAEFFVSRRVRDNDAYWDLAAPGYGFKACCHDASLDVGGGGLWWVGDKELTLRGVLTRELNRYFVSLNDVWSFRVEASARWRLRP